MRRDLIIKNIQNNTIQPIFVQFEPWADLVYLLPKESICIGVSPEEHDGLEVTKDADTWFVNLPNAKEYFYIEGEETIEHTQYGSNVLGWSKPLHQLSSLRGNYIPNGKTP